MIYFARFKSGLELKYQSRDRDKIFQRILMNGPKTELQVMTPALREHSYKEAREENYGWCRKCRDLSYGSVEPDAENYECDECGSYQVYGIEQGLIMGLFAILSDEETVVDLDVNSEAEAT